MAKVVSHIQPGQQVFVLDTLGHGLHAGQTVTLGSGGSAESFTITSIAGCTATVHAHVAKAHEFGETIA